MSTVVDDRLGKVVAWYDNESRSSNRVVEMAARVPAGAPVA